MSTFPGGTSVTFLDVYDDEASDGVCGGSPHVHLVSTEAYVVTAGRGELHTLDASGFGVTPLEAGSVVWFTPGTIHRAVNLGDLRVVVLMGNAGLPEAGDAVLTFPSDVVTDAAAYRAASTLAPLDETSARADSARRRRDLAVKGFNALRDAVDRGDASALEEFYAAAGGLVRERAAAWPGLVREGPLREAEASLARAEAVADGSAAHLHEGRVRVASSPAGERGFGMCGRLSVYDVQS